MLKNITISRVITQWVINAAGLLLLAVILPGVAITQWSTAFVAAAILGFLNAMLWPLFVRFALPVTVATFGLGSLLFNGIIISLTATLLPGLEIANVFVAILVAFGLTIVSTFVRQLLAIDDDDTFYRNIIRRQAEKDSPVTDTDTQGTIFLQIDGLGYEVFQRAIRDGNIPTMAKWLSSGSHKIEPWETDWSSQTGASQAGILMGNNNEIPAFRWYEKESGRTMTFTKPDDLTEIEKRLSKKDGLLCDNGASRGNLLSGDAGVTLLTLSTVKNPDRKHFGQDYYAYFANPYNFTRTIILTIKDIFRELRSSLDLKKRDVWPRLDHKGKYYSLVRAWTTVVQRDIVVQTLISDMYKGKSAMYADFVGYDDVAHRSGIERYVSLEILRDIDQQFSRLVKAAQDTPKKYKFIILSDHGQTQGATFTQRTGYSLQELVENLTKKKVSAETDNHEDTNFLNAAVMEATQPTNFASRILNSLTKDFRKKYQNQENKRPAQKDVKIMASGCMGLIYFTKFKHRLTLEEINRRYPNLISGLLANPFIGFLLVDSKKDGGVVLGKNGTYYLKNDSHKNENPLLPFGERAARHIKRTHSFKYVGDIMINSIYDETMDEVVPFEELIGSHGGLGGNQTQPFVLFPKNLEFPEAPVIGAENLHKIMKRWLNDISLNKSVGHI